MNEKENDIVDDVKEQTSNLRQLEKTGRRLARNQASQRGSSNIRNPVNPSMQQQHPPAMNTSTFRQKNSTEIANNVVKKTSREVTQETAKEAAKGAVKGAAKGAAKGATEGAALGGIGALPGAAIGAATDMSQNIAQNTSKTKEGKTGGNKEKGKAKVSGTVKGESETQSIMNHPLLIIIAILLAVMILIIGSLLSIVGTIITIVATPFLAIYEGLIHSEDNVTALIERIGKQGEDVSFQDANNIILEDMDKYIQDALSTVCRIEVLQIAEENEYDIDLTIESFENAAIPYIYATDVKDSTCNINYSELLDVISIAEFWNTSYTEFDYDKFCDILDDDEFQRCLYTLKVVPTELIEWSDSFDEDESPVLEADGSITVTTQDGSYTISSEDAGNYYEVTIYGSVSIEKYNLKRIFNYFGLNPDDKSELYPSMTNYRVIEVANDIIRKYKEDCFWGYKELGSIDDYTVLTGKLEKGNSDFVPSHKPESSEQTTITDYADIDLSVISDDIEADIANGYYTLEDYSYMVAVMSSEALGDLKGSVAVGYCVKYRAEVNHTSVKAVVTASGQFASPWYKYINKPKNDTVHKAAIMVLKGEIENPVPDCYFFFSASAVTCFKPGTYHVNVGGNMYYKQWGDVHTKHTSSHNCTLNVKK